MRHTGCGDTTMELYSIRWAERGKENGSVWLVWQPLKLLVCGNSRDVLWMRLVIEKPWSQQESPQIRSLLELSAKDDLETPHAVLLFQATTVMAMTIIITADVDTHPTAVVQTS